MFKNIVLSVACLFLASNALAFDYTCKSPVGNKTFTVYGDDMQITIRSSELPMIEGEYTRAKLPAAALRALYSGWNDHDERVSLDLPKTALSESNSKGFRAVLTSKDITSESSSNSVMFICIR